jgi:hypothetical protein
LNWKFSHPKAWGRGVQLPGVFDSGAKPQPAIPDATLWEDFIKRDNDSGRWLVGPPEPTSFDSFIEFQFDPVPIRDARFVQIAIRVDSRSKFKFYLRFNDNRWIGYSSEPDSGKSSHDPEYWIKDHRLAPSDAISFVTRDIRKDLEHTWHLEKVTPTSVEAVRLRGGFGLLLVRII